MFNYKYSSQHFPQSTVSKIEKKFRETGHVKNIEKLGRNDQFINEKKLDVLLEIEENLHKTTRELAADKDVK